MLWTIQTFFSGLYILRKEFKGLSKKNTHVIVHGDTMSSVIGALITKVFRFKLFHIESGLRSFSFSEPFPEELSRYLISHLAQVHFCPNQWAIDNLKNTKTIKINTKQNTLIESLSMALDTKKPIEHDRVSNNKYFVLVLHRQENVIFKKKKSKELLEYILMNAPNKLDCVFIMHELTQSFLKSNKLPKGISEKIIAKPRLPYADFAVLLDNAEFIVTDGGSNQEEAYYLGKPCLLLRGRTERIEGLGKNVVLSGARKNKIKEFLNEYQKYVKNRVIIEDTPSKIIVDHLIGESQ